MKKRVTVILLTLVLIVNCVYADFVADTTKGMCPSIITFTENDGGVKWEWDFGDGSPKCFTNPATHPYTYNGRYTVTCKVTYSDNHIETIIKTQYITIGDVCVINYTEKNDTCLYPNPCNSYIKLSDVVQYSIYNTAGVLVISGFNNYIDVSYISCGIYFVVIGNKRYKIVKK